MAVADLEHLRIDDPSIDDERAARFWLIIKDLDTVLHKEGHPVERKVVSGTKTLHPLLPNLVFPIDNKYTGMFFGLRDFGPHQEKCFKDVFRRVVTIARAVAPQSYVGEGWNSCTTKVLDNAIIGYCLSEGPEAIIESIESFAKQRGREDLLEPGRTADLTKWVREELRDTELPPQS